MYSTRLVNQIHLRQPDFRKLFFQYIIKLYLILSIASNREKISNNSKVLTWLKDFITKKYNIKDLRKVKSIIKQQITKNLNIGTLKID